MKEFKNSSLVRKDLISQACYDQYFNYLSKIYPGYNSFHDDVKDKLIGYYCEGNPILLKAGSVSDKCWFINEGGVSVYYYDHNKNASVYLIYVAGETAIVPRSFKTGEVSTDFMMALPGTHLLELNVTDVEEIYKKYPQTERITTMILAYQWEKPQRRDRLIRFVAKERIKEFYKTDEGILLGDKRVSGTQKIISSYLMLKVPTVSKLCKEIKEEEEAELCRVAESE